LQSKADARSEPPNSGSPIFSQPDLTYRLHKSFLTKRCETCGRNRPTNPNILDLIIVPGRAFTLSGIRIGRGGGAYDRFLASLPRKIPTISLTLDFQIFNNLPHKRHDISIDKVVVEI
jgi:5,10-methenyltetrahydrofolate synthetase